MSEHDHVLDRVEQTSPTTWRYYCTVPKCGWRTDSLTGPSQDEEIARLRAEVERLKNELKTYEINWPDVMKLERERDEALALVNELKDRLQRVEAAAKRVVDEAFNPPPTRHRRKGFGWEGCDVICQPCARMALKKALP